MERDVGAEKKERKKKKKKRRVIKVRGPRERVLNTTFYQSKHQNELIGSPVFPRKQTKKKKHVNVCFLLANLKCQGKASE